jgi:GST-like protein
VTLELYHHGSSACAAKVRFALAEKRLTWASRYVDILKGEQFAPEFLAIAPNNRIPAIVDHAPAIPGGPLSLFESGAILLYLAEKTGQLIPAEPRTRWECVQWLFWQMGGLGPMGGQTHHFLHYAPEQIPYAIDRYVRETGRLYAVLDHRLRGRDYITGEYSIADIACYPWVQPERQRQDIDEFPDLKRWKERIAARPATLRAYEIAKKINVTPSVRDEQSRKVLFGQDQHTVR